MTPKPRRWVPLEGLRSAGVLSHYEWDGSVMWGVERDGHRAPSYFFRTPADMLFGVFREVGPEVKTPGYKVLCSWCQERGVVTHLPDSDLKGTLETHGMCEACAAQWANPHAPKPQEAA